MRVRALKMACCCSSHEPIDHRRDFILDVEMVLQDHVWKTYKNSRSSWQKMCLRRKDFVVDVPMNYFHFDKIKEDVRPRQIAAPLAAAASAAATNAPFSSNTSSQRPPTLTQSMTHMGRDVTHNPWLSSNHVALSTDFTNSTNTEQTYSFRFEKTRKASLNVSFQKGFTVGGKVNFSLGLPKSVADCKVGAETDMRVTVSKATGEVVEETLTWTASSDIKVADNSTYTAKVLLSEAPVSYDFKLWTKMSMPSGGAPATVTRKKGGDAMYTHVIENLKLVFDGYKIVDHFPPQELPGGECVTYPSVVFRTSGIVDGIRLSDQKILLDSRSLKKTSSSSSSSQGPYPQGPVAHNSVAMSDGYPEDGYLGSAVAPPLRGRMLALGSSSQHPPPPPPIIEEVLEDDGGVGEEGGSGHPPSSPPFHVLARGSGGGAAAAGYQVPRITTTSPSSLASSPLSDAGSPDMSENSKKSQTVTTV